MNDFAANSIDEIYIKLSNISCSVLIYCCEGENVGIKMLVDNIFSRKGSRSKVKMVNG